MLTGYARTWFNDLPSLPTSPKLSTVTVKGGNRLDSVSFKLTSGATFTHGGTGGTAASLTLASGESITSAKLCWDEYNGQTRNFYVLFTTSTGRTVTTGKTTANCATATAPSGFGIVGMYGRAGDEVDELGWVYGKQ